MAKGVYEEELGEEDSPLVTAEALVELSGINLAELNGLNDEQLESLFFADGTDHSGHLGLEQSVQDEIKKKNLDVIRLKLQEIRSS